MRAAETDAVRRAEGRVDQSQGEHSSALRVTPRGPLLFVVTDAFGSHLIIRVP